MTTLIVVQARLASKRLPRKCLMDIAGHPLIWHVVERAKAVRYADAVVLACPLHDAADFLPAVDCPVMGWDGEEDDVLGRFQWVAAQLKPDVVVRVTGDCPLLMPEAVEWALLDVDARGYSATEHERSNWPDGTGCEAFYRCELDRHFGFVLVEHQHFTRNFGEPSIPQPIYRLRLNAQLSVNTPADLDRVRAIYAYLPPGDTSWHGLVDACRKAGVC